MSIDWGDRRARSVKFASRGHREGCGKAATTPQVPRLAPELPLPPYAYVRGRHPHPKRDPRGHSYGAAEWGSSALEPERWYASTAYLYGVDLFNRGYYWEAHEVWEGLWHACGRRGPTADFLKGLIALAAAGFQLRARRPRGIRRHGARARALFERAAQAVGPDRTRYLGLGFDDLVRVAAELADAEHPPASGPEERLAFVLHPASGE